VRHCCGAVRIDLNGSKASLRRLRVDQRGLPSRRVLTMCYYCVNRGVPSLPDYVDRTDLGSRTSLHRCVTD